MENKKLSRKEREKEFKRNEILEASIKIFAKKGFKSTTLDDIAEAAEFGKGTIYNYFSSKEDIYKSIITKILDSHVKSLDLVSENTNTFYDFIYQTTLNHFDFCISNRDKFLLLMFTKMHHANSTTPEISKLMSKNEKKISSFLISKINDAIKRKEIKKIDPERIVRYFMIAGFGYTYDFVISQKTSKDDIKEEAKFLTNLLFTGIKK